RPIRAPDGVKPGFAWPGVPEAPEPLPPGVRAFAIGSAARPPATTGPTGRGPPARPPETPAPRPPALPDAPPAGDAPAVAPARARAPAARLCSSRDWPGAGWRVTVTRKIVEATWCR